MRYLLIFIYILFLSCTFTNPNPTGSPFINNQGSTGDDSSEDDDEPVVREKPDPDPVKQQRCGRNSTTQTLCEKSSNCGDDVCDELFSGSDRKECYKLPESLVLDFENVLKAIKDGEAASIRPTTLDCLLDIDDREFERAVRKMSKNEAKEFLVEVARDDDLSDIFGDEDNNYHIIDALLTRATGKTNLVEQLSTTIEDNQHFLWLASEGVKEVWNWLDNYVSNERSDQDTIVTYCEVLLKMTNSKLNDFLEDRGWFDENYRADVEDESENRGYLYEAVSADSSRRRGKEGDFRDWCRLQQATNAPCPDDGREPHAFQLLARITFQSDGGKAVYQSEEFCYQESDTVPAQANRNHPTVYGSTTNPSNQDIIIRLDSYGRLFLNKDAIDNIEEYDSSNTYYLYVDDDRLTLIDAYSYRSNPTSCPDNPSSGKNILVFDPDALENKFRVQSYNIYLASQDSDGNCKYYK